MMGSLAAAVETLWTPFGRSSLPGESAVLPLSLPCYGIKLGPSIPWEAVSG